MNKSGCLLHLRIAFEATNPDRDLQPKPSTRLSWDSSSWLCPTSDVPNRVHSRFTPRDVFLRTQTDQGLRHVPLLWFCATPAACSALRVRACCIPVPDEVRDVCARHRPDSEEPGPTARSAPRFHTLRRLSPVSSRSASLRPLPSCRSLQSLSEDRSMLAVSKRRPGRCHPRDFLRGRHRLP